METTNNIHNLLTFLSNSPCNFLAIHTAKALLSDAGFREQKIGEKLRATAGDKFFVTKNDSAIFAFVIGSKPVKETGFRIIAAHSDSPCFRIKPHAEIKSADGIVRLNTEVYGGPILYTWFDRPLSIAGRVIVKGEDELRPRTMTLHIKLLYGSNDHHKAEAVYKAVAHALKTAVTFNSDGSTLSTKGVL